MDPRKRKGSAQYFSQATMLVPQNFRDFSSLLMEIVIGMIKSGDYHVKYTEIFIDLNNSLHEIYLNQEYKYYPIAMLTNNVNELLMNLKNKLPCKSCTKIDIMDDCMIFKFLHYNMINIFPNGRAVVDFSLDEEEADDWWNEKFGILLFVSVPIFWKNLSEMFPEKTDFEAIIKSIIFTSHKWFSEYINKSAFNMFLRFYGGWKNFAKTWTQIYYHPAHMIFCSSEHAENELKIIKNKSTRSAEKSYVFCLNWRCDEGLWNILYIDENNDIVNKLIKSSMLLKELEYTKFYLYPKGKNPIITKRESITLPSLPAYTVNEDNLYSLPQYSRQNTLQADDTNCSNTHIGLDLDTLQYDDSDQYMSIRQGILEADVSDDSDAHICPNLDALPTQYDDSNEYMSLRPINLRADDAEHTILEAKPNDDIEYMSMTECSIHAERNINQESKDFESDHLFTSLLPVPSDDH